MKPIVRTGLDLLLAQDAHFDLLADQRVGLITNHTAVDRDLTSIVDLLHADERFTLTHLFAPEHGVRGSVQAGDHIADANDARTGLPVTSLYGETKKPSPDMLADVDVLVFDIQDAGTRYYTYISTMVLAMECAAEAHIPFVVLDRPNPITGLHPEGPILDPQFSSFVGIHPMPTRHALTIGEIALLVAEDRDLPIPSVVEMTGWNRDMWWEDTGLPFIQPSPNLPTIDSLRLYPGTCLFEATTLSEGRGTTRPFELIGGPDVDAYALADDLNARELPGVRFRPASFVPSFSKHQGLTCEGIQVHIRDRDALRPVALGVHVIHAIASQPDSGFAWRPGAALGMSAELLYGNADLHAMIDAGAMVDDIIARWQNGLEAFATRADAVHLYGNDPTKQSSGGGTISREA